MDLLKRTYMLVSGIQDGAICPCAIHTGHTSHAAIFPHILDPSPLEQPTSRHKQ